MVKNAFGGKKTKKGGRKHTNIQRRGVRYIEEEGETYAAVTKLFGGDHCEVMCSDGVKRMCVIRKKFKGRGKRDNLLANGVWVLVGVRDWESRGVGKEQKCDLLAVYSQGDKDKLRQSAACDFGSLVGLADEEDAEEDTAQFDFVDEKTSAYQQAIENAVVSKGTTVNIGEGDQSEPDVDVDDI
jgi:translation initiation factor 1A